MVVGSSGFAAKLSVAELPHIAPKTLAGATGFFHTALQELLHEECTLVRNHLLCLNAVGIDLAAVFVDNSCHQDRLMMHTVVGNGAIGVGHFQERDITGT